MRKIVWMGAWLAFSISGIPASWAQAAPLNVVATTSIIADVARNVGGDLVQVTALVPPNTDVHAFQPAPQDVVLLTNADLVLVNGAGLELFLGGLLENVTDVELVVVSDGVSVLAAGEHHDEAEHDHTLAATPTETPAMSGMDHSGHTMSADMGVPSAAYMTITNTGTTTDTLIAIQTDAVTQISFHETVVVNDLASMSPLPNGVEIPAGGTVELRPAGIHAMLEGVKHDLILGEAVDLTLVFASGLEIVVNAAIDDIPPETVNEITQGNLIVSTVWVRPALGMEEAEPAHDHAAEAEEHHHAEQDYIGVLGTDADCSDATMHAEVHADADHEHGACDPHVWTDPQNVMIWADNIAAAFAQADPANAAVYTANAEAYKAQLAALDEEVTQILAVIPAEKRILVTNHEFLRYFAAHYEFEIVGTVLPGFDTLSEPDPQSLAALVETINAEGVNAIFVEVSDAGALADAVAQEAGRDMQVITLYSDSLSDAGGDAGTYLDYLRYNATAIATALGE
jgi:ABC-type Zn uptake system ZnuABC Zn-binding protein ZnuA